MPSAMTLPKSAALAEEYGQRILLADPVLAYVARWRLSPLTFGVVVALSMNLIRLLIAWWEGHVMTSRPTGFVRDPATFTNAAFGVAVVAWCAWTPTGLGMLIGGLRGAEL